MTLGPGQHVLRTEIYPLVIKHGCDITYKRRLELENHVLNGQVPQMLFIFIEDDIKYNVLDAAWCGLMRLDAAWAARSGRLVQPHAQFVGGRWLAPGMQRCQQPAHARQLSLGRSLDQVSATRHPSEACTPAPWLYRWKATLWLVGDEPIIQCDLHKCWWLLACT